MFIRTTGNLRRQQITAQYWFLVEDQGWLDGGTTYDAKLPIPGNRPPACFAVGAWVQIAGTAPYWVERWRWQGDGMAAVLMEKFGMRPPCVLEQQAQQTQLVRQSAAFSKPGHLLAGHPTTSV